MTLKENRPHAQHVDGLRQQIVRRGGAYLQPQRLQFFDYVARIRMSHFFRSHAEVQSRQGVRRILGTRERPDDVQQFFLSRLAILGGQQESEAIRIGSQD
jgi:hypothetical protein